MKKREWKMWKKRKKERRKKMPTFVLERLIKLIMTFLNIGATSLEFFARDETSEHEDFFKKAMIECMNRIKQ